MHIHRVGRRPWTLTRDKAQQTLHLCYQDTISLSTQPLFCDCNSDNPLLCYIDTFNTLFRTSACFHRAFNIRRKQITHWHYFVLVQIVYWSLQSTQGLRERGHAGSKEDRQECRDSYAGGLVDESILCHHSQKSKYRHATAVLQRKLVKSRFPGNTSFSLCSAGRRGS